MHDELGLGRFVQAAVADMTGTMLIVRSQMDVLSVLLTFMMLSLILALTAGSGSAAMTAVLFFVAFD